jgi:hypothetical protein
MISDRRPGRSRPTQHCRRAELRPAAECRVMRTELAAASRILESSGATPPYGGGRGRRDTRLDPFLSLRATVGYSGLSNRTLRGYLGDATHPLPHYRVAGKILVRRSHFDLWMEAYQRTRTPADLEGAVAGILRDLGQSGVERVARRRRGVIASRPQQGSPPTEA